MTGEITVVPANEAACGDIQTVFGSRGSATYCQCQRYKLAPREAFKSFPAEERARRLREQTNCGRSKAATTSGLVAYLDGEPVGWCAVEPRPAYQGLLRVYRVPWEGRTEDKTDESVWAVTCVFARAGFRRRGVGHALARAAVDFARERGARALEAYPMLTRPREEITWGELHMGTRSMFAAAGYAEVAHPTPRRVVMRIDFDDRLPASAEAGQPQHLEERHG
jgi:GNAT superfamily N-acetyltransferase